MSNRYLEDQNKVILIINLYKSTDLASLFMLAHACSCLLMCALLPFLITIDGLIMPYLSCSGSVLHIEKWLMVGMSGTG